MTSSGVAFWWAFLSGVALGAVVTAVACGRMEALGRLWDRILGDVAPEPRPTRVVVRIAGQLPNVAPPRTQLHPPSPPPPPPTRQLHVRLVRDDGPGGAA